MVKAQEAETSLIATALAVHQEAHKVTQKKINTKLQEILWEHQIQEFLGLKVKIGGLPTQWCMEETTFKELATKLNDLLQPINIQTKDVSQIKDTHKRVPARQGRLFFKEKKGQTQLLCQSHILNGKKI